LSVNDALQQLLRTSNNVAESYELTTLVTVRSANRCMPIPLLTQTLPMSYLALFKLFQSNCAQSWGFKQIK